MIMANELSFHYALDLINFDRDSGHEIHQRGVVGIRDDVVRIRKIMADDYGVRIPSRQ